MRKFSSLGKRRKPETADHRNPLNNALLAYHHGSRSGPNPLDAELKLRPPRPSIAKKQGRRKKKQGTWYIVNGPSVYRSTGCSEKEYERAKLVLDIYKNEEIEKVTGSRLPGNLTFDQVLADHTADLRLNAHSKSTRRKAQREGSMCKTLLRVHFAGRTLASYRKQDSLDFKAKLIALRSKHCEQQGIDADQEELEQYPHACLETLRSAIREYPARHGQFWCIPIHVPWKKRRRRTHWLTKQEVTRLLQACLGYVWDWENGCWKTKQVQTPDGNWQTTRRVNTQDSAFMRQGMSRMIRLILRTGMRHEAVLLMKWGLWPNLGGIQFTDATGNGYVHRRGTEEYNTNKSLGTSEIFEELKVILRIWARQDGYIENGTVKKTGLKKFIIRDEEDKSYQGYALEEFRQICEWAGVNGQTTVHALKHTAATWCKQKDYSDEAIAEMLDTSVETLREFYMHVSKEIRMRYARREFDNRAKRREWRLVEHNDPDPTDPKRMRDRPPPRRRAASPSAVAL